MRLKCKCPSGVFVLENDLSPESPFNDLISEISTTSGLDRSMIIVKTGYPPKIISAQTIKESGIKDGDRIIVEIGKPETIVESKIDKPVVTIEVEQDIIVVREMKDDNSCLFRSIAYVFLRDAECHSSLRQIVISAIKADPITYSEIVLGRIPKEYCDWIAQKNAWGGAIELSIFAEHFKAEIASIDVQTQRADIFGEGKYKERAMILYSGIHYDAFAFSPSKNAPLDFDQTLFEVTNIKTELYLVMAKAQAKIYHTLRKFTDMANFTLKCGDCKVGLKGEREAREHATNTGHHNFEEY